MPSVNIQFHMLFEELIQFVTDVCAHYALEVELERWYPKASRELSSDANLAEEIERFGHVDRFWLLCKPVGSPKTERFMLNVGRTRGHRLAQADLGAGTNNVSAFGVLKKIAKELKNRTTAGIWVIGETGIVGYDKKFRISPGAAKAARAGDIDLVSIAFTQSFRVDPPDA